MVCCDVSKSKEEHIHRKRIHSRTYLPQSCLRSGCSEESDLKVIIVDSMEPNLPGFIGSIAKMSVNDLKNSLATLRRAGDGRVQTYPLIWKHNAISERRTQIHVHSKIMIVDERWITVGSANVDKDGFKDSSELNLGITSQKLAQELRIRLWQEHLQDYASTADMRDFNQGFRA